MEKAKLDKGTKTGKVGKRIGKKLKKKLAAILTKAKERALQEACERVLGTKPSIAVLKLTTRKRGLVILSGYRSHKEKFANKELLEKNSDSVKAAYDALGRKWQSQFPAAFRGIWVDPPEVEERSERGEGERDNEGQQAEARKERTKKKEEESTMEIKKIPCKRMDINQWMEDGEKAREVLIDRKGDKEALEVEKMAEGEKEITQDTQKTSQATTAAGELIIPKEKLWTELRWDGYGNYDTFESSKMGFTDSSEMEMGATRDKDFEGQLYNFRFRSTKHAAARLGQAHWRKLSPKDRREIRARLARLKKGAAKL